MTVKDRVGRTRYAVVRVEGGPLGRGALAAALPPAAKLTRFDGTWGVLRTTHRDLPAVLEALAAVDRVGAKPVTLRTVVVSGTLRKAAEAVPRDSPVATRSRPARK